jgi:hypothetical protein
MKIAVTLFGSVTAKSGNFYVQGRRISNPDTVVQFSLPAADSKRLDTWMPAIAQTLLPGTPCHDTGDELRIGRKGSCAIYRDGHWHDYEADTWGDSAVTLIAHLLDGDLARTRRFALEWLQTHPGVGSSTITDDNSDAAQQRAAVFAARAREALAKMVPLLGTESAVNLVEHRGLPPVFPPLLGHLKLCDARLGEAALVATFTNEAGEIGGVQLGYLTPRGTKSEQLPQRAQFWIEPDRAKRRNYLFRIAATPVAENPLAGVTLVAEGIEKCLALHAAFPGCPVLGLGGIGRLRHVPPIMHDVLIVPDGDKPDSRAHKTLLRGIDHLWLTGATSVRAALMLPGEDADSFLKKHGIEALRTLIFNAEERPLSPDGEAQRLARIRDPIDFALARNKVAKDLKIPKSALDAAIKTKREAVEEATVSIEDTLGPEPWPQPVDDIGAVLSEASAEIAKHVSTTQVLRDTAVLWAAHTHFVHHEFIQLPISPQLGIRSVAPECGKSTFLDATSFLVRRPIRAASLTPAVVYRVIDAMHPTLMLDECDELLRKDKNPELVAILRSSHRRRDAIVWRSVPTPDGDWTVKAFSAWGTYGYTAVRRIEEALQSRAITLVLQRAKPEERKRLRPLEDGMSQVLLDCGRKITRWAQDQVTLPDDVPIPDEVDFRDRDNWRPLLRIAKAAGEAWYQRACAAARTINGTTVAIGDVVPLLTDIREVFGTKDRLTTQALVDGMLNLPEPSEDWTHTYSGLSINSYYLRDRLKGVIDPPEEERRWPHGAGKVRGYLRKHFDEAFARYLPAVEDADQGAQSSSPNFSEASPSEAKTSGPSGPETKTVPISSSYDTSIGPDKGKQRLARSGQISQSGNGADTKTDTSEPRI